MSQQPIIDDEELIEELKRYGEKNLPTLGGTGSTTKTPKGRKSGAGVQLNDQNRDIYLKKLNHYRAREKADQNPSKYLKQVANSTTVDVSTTSSSSSAANVKRRSSARFNLQDNLYYDNDDPDDLEEDVVEINGPTNNTTCEYIQVNNAHTSPMSSNNTMYGENDDYEDEVVIEKHVPPSPLKNRDNYDNLNIDLKLQKEKIELNKTLSKYRNEIQSIISGSLIKSRQSNQSPLKSEPVEATSTTTTTLYCPKVTTTSKPSRSVFESIRSAFVREQSNETSKRSERSNSDDVQEGDPYSKLSQIRGGHADLRQRIASSQASRSQQQQQQHNLPVKSDWRIKQRFSNFVNNILVPTLTSYIPYIMIAILTIVFLQYLRVIQQTSVDDGISSSSIESAKPNTPTTGSYCWDVKDIRCSQTKTLVKELIDYLRIRSGQVDCSAMATVSSEMDQVTANSKANPAFIEKCIHLNTVINYFTRERGLIKSADRVKEAMESVLSAVQRNPHWGIRLLNSGYMDTYTSEDVTYVMSTVSVKSLSCRLFELLHFIYVRVVMLGVFTLTCGLIWLVVRSVRRINEERERQFFAMVSQVTNMIEKQYEMSLTNPEIKPYLAISHVYDTLVEPSQRAKKRNLWSKVVKFIEDNESRIHLETQFIDGEETHAWKWVLPKHSAQVKIIPPFVTPLIAPTTMPGAKINDGIGLANSTMLPPTISVELVHTGNSPHKIHDLKAAHGGGIYLDQLNSQNMHNGVGGHVYASHQYEPEVTDMNRDFSSTSTQNTNSTGANSAWQGEAFNRSDKLANSPTPCLKIRNMFDQMEVETDALLAVRIHNDILEKCCAVQRHPVTGQTINIINENILHIVCDKKSKEGCVYVKCSSNEAAGRVYSTLNGVWYQGKLLNVKFLKSDRYLERFPDSALYTKPIQPIAM